MLGALEIMVFCLILIWNFDFYTSELAFLILFKQKNENYSRLIENPKFFSYLFKIIENIIVNNNFWKGARHIFSPEVVTKYELVKLISDIYNLNVTVIPFECDLPIDRSLTTIYNIKQFNISSLKTQIEEQRDFFEKIKNV